MEYKSEKYVWKSVYKNYLHYKNKNQNYSDDELNEERPFNNAFHFVAGSTLGAIEPLSVENG